MPIIGDIFGGLFGGGRQTQTSQVVSSTQLPPEMKAYVKGAGEQGLKALSTTIPRMSAGGAYEVVRPRSIAPFSTDQHRAMGMTRSAAMAGNPLFGTSMAEANKMAGGGYLNSNRFIDDVLAAETDRIMGDVNSRFASFGRFGSGQHAGVAGREIAKATAPILARNYENERGRQMQAMGMLPMLDAARFTDAQALAGIGDVVQSRNQDVRNAEYQAAQDRAARQLERDIALGNLGMGVGNVANVGASSTRTVTEPSNTLGNALSGVGYGAQIGNMFGMPLLGAGLGGLAGLLG